MKRVLISLFIVAGVVYATNTWLLPNTNGSSDDGQSNVDKPNSNEPTALPREEQQIDPLTPPVDANSTHAIVVEESPSPPLPNAEVADIDGSQIELVKLTARASIQEGPSASAPIIGIAHSGAETQVISRESEWAQIIDPLSKKTGWVHSRFLEPRTGTG